MKPKDEPQKEEKEWTLVVENNITKHAKKNPEIVLEQYKEYLRTASDWDKSSATSDRFFSTICLAILSGYIILLKGEITIPTLGISALIILSISFSLMWLLVNISYAKAVSVKMEVAQEIEEFLPLRPLKYEWEEKFKKRNYIRISRIQRIFPLIFIIFYLLIGLSIIKS